MKKFLKLTTVVVSMVMSLTFVSCANGNTSNNGNENSNENTSNNGNESSNENTSNNGNENSNEEELNLVRTYGISKIENLIKDSKSEQAYTTTMPTSSSLRQYGTQKLIKGKTTTVIESEIDVTITKTATDYSFNWAKYNINGEAASDAAKTDIEKKFTNDYWNSYTAMFTMTYTTTADGKWSDNNTPASSGTYTVDKANSKVTIKTLIRGEETLTEPEIMEATYSDNGKTLVVMRDDSNEEETDMTTMTLTRK
ncbi:MAG: hypothetical protein ACI4LS_09535 [Treponema sp.]